jgi:predicted dehydrogenase
VSCFKEAKRLISSGAFGRIHHIRVEAYGPVVLRPKGATWRGARGEGGGCLYDYACHAIDIANFLVGPPKAVGGTVLNKIFSKDVEDEVHATLYFDGELTGEIAANWSDDSHRRMWVQVNVWGTNGRMIVDRQELKTYIRRATDDSNAALKPGWNIRYATDFPEPVWYYLRGEEYSSQIDYFIRCILAGRQDNVSSFASAVETDVALSMMLQDGGRPARTAAVGQDGRARAQRPWLHLFAKA